MAGLLGSDIEPPAPPDLSEPILRLNKWQQQLVGPAVFAPVPGPGAADWTGALGLIYQLVLGPLEAVCYLCPSPPPPWQHLNHVQGSVWPWSVS